MAAMVLRNKNAKPTARGFEATNWVDFVRQNEHVLRRIRELPTTPVVPADTDTHGER